MGWALNSSLLHNGKNYRYSVFLQNYSNDCTAAAIVMMVKYLFGRTMPCTLAHLWIRQIESLDVFEQMDIQQGDRLHKRPAADNSWLWNEDMGAVSMGVVFYALRQYLAMHPWYQITQTGATDVVPDQLMECTPKRPAITAIRWDYNRIGHVVVCLGKILFRNEIIFLDPANGLVISPIRRNAQGCLIYNTQRNSLNKPRRTAVIESAIFS